MKRTDPTCDPGPSSLCPAHEAEYQNEWLPRQWDREGYLSMRSVQPVVLAKGNVTLDWLEGLDRILVNVMMEPVVKGPVTLSALEATSWRDAFDGSRRELNLQSEVGSMLWWGVAPEMFSAWNPRVGRPEYPSPAFAIRHAWFHAAVNDSAESPLRADQTKNMMALSIATRYIDRKEVPSWWSLLVWSPIADVLLYRDMQVSPKQAFEWKNTTGKGARRLQQWLKHVDGDRSDALTWGVLESWMRLGLRGPKLRLAMSESFDGDARLATVLAKQLGMTVFRNVGEELTLHWCADLATEMDRHGLTAENVCAGIRAWEEAVGIPPWSIDVAMWRGPLTMDAVAPGWVVSHADQTIVASVALQSVVQAARMHASDLSPSSWKPWLDAALHLALQRGTQGSYLFRGYAHTVLVRPMDMIDTEVGPQIAAGLTPEAAASQT